MFFTGLMVTPRVRFLQRLKKAKKGLQNADDEDSDDDEQHRNGQKQKKPQPTINKIMSFDSDSGSEDDLIKIKRTNHEIENESNDESPPLIDLNASKQKKPVTKASIAKKLQKKQIIPNRKTVFDDEGNTITSTSKSLQSDLAREYENDGESGINIDKARRLMEEEDKFDKQRFKELVQKKHKDAKKKAKKVEKESEEEDEKDDFGTDSEEDQPDLSWLPDPDKVYGNRGHETFNSDEEFDPRVATGSSSDESEEELEAIHRPPTKLVTKKVGKKRQLEQEVDVSDTETPTKVSKPKKKQKTKEIVSKLSLNEAEQLAMQLLG